MDGSLQQKAYGGVLLLLNTAAATSIIFCNKLVHPAVHGRRMATSLLSGRSGMPPLRSGAAQVLSVYGFKFPYALTLLHALVTLAGMLLFSSLGLYKRKAVPVMQVTPRSSCTCYIAGFA